MDCIKFPLNHQPAGRTVEVSLDGVESDVFLVDSANLSRLERGGQFRYHGGHAKRSPIRLQMPFEGDWTAVVVPLPGGQVRASVRLVA